MKIIPYNKALIVLLTAVMASSTFAQGIRPWPENLYYWEFRGKPTLLLGGSIDDDLFQYEGFEQQLDTWTHFNPFKPAHNINSTPA